MRVPTLPDAPPARGSAERACAGCGAANRPTSAFCWRCYRHFDTGSAAPTRGSTFRGRPGALPGPQPWGPAPQAGPAISHASGGWGGLATMAGVVALTVAVIAGVVFVLNRRDAVAVPTSLGGMPMVEDAQTRLVVDLFRAQADATGIEGDIVLYGNGTPTAALVWVRDATIPSSDEAFDAFAAGFNEGIGVSGSLGAKGTETIADVTYVCAPVLGASRGTVCMWQVEDVFWLLLDLSGGAFEAGRDLAVLAHDAVIAA